MNRQKLSLVVSQRQIEHLLILLGILQLRHRAHIRIRIAANIRHNVALLQRHQRSEVTARVPQSNWTLEAKVRLPDQRQVNALEVSEPDILTSEALNILDAVYNNRPAKDVTQSKYVRLLQRRARLVSQCKNIIPILLKLIIVQCVIQ